MSFTPASFSTHAQYLPKNLPLLLEPGFFNDSHLKVPIPRISTLIAPASPFLDLTPKDWSIEACRASTLQFPPLNSRKLLSASSTHTQPLSFTPFLSGIGNGREKGNTFDFKHWQTSSEWLKYVENVKLKTFKRSHNEHSKDGIFTFSDWPNVIRAQKATTDKEDVTMDDVKLETNIDHIKKSGLKSTSNADGTQVIRHSIREILKPRENSRIQHDSRRHKRHAQTLDDEESKRKIAQSTYESCLNRKHAESDDVRSDKNHHKDVRLKLRQKVSSILTNPSTSHAEILYDVSPPKMSRKSKAHSAFDSFGDLSTFSRSSATVPDFLGSRPISPQASLTRIQSERKTFQCPQCRYVTDRKNNLKRHIVTMHQDSGKVLECCGIPFQSKAALRDHNTVFHRGGYRCQICARNFCRKALLRRHLTVHSGQKDFFCELCGYATSHKSNLERHQKVHVRKSDDIRSMGPKQPSQSKSSLNMSHTENRMSKQVTSSPILNVDHATPNTGDEYTDIGINEHGYFSNLGHVDDVTESPPNREFYSPTRYKGKRAGFFTSRLEETYDKTAKDTESFIPSLPSEPNEMINIDSNYAFKQSGHDLFFINNNQETDNANCEGQCSKQENGNSDSKTIETDRRIFHVKEESSEKTLGVRAAGELVSIHENVNEPSDSINPNFATEEEAEFDLALTLKEVDETLWAEKDMHKKRNKIQSKCKICPLFYQCDDCGQKLPSQHEVHSHSCSKISGGRILGLSLVTALQKGCLKTQNLI